MKIRRLPPDEAGPRVLADWYEGAQRQRLVLHASIPAAREIVRKRIAAYELAPWGQSGPCVTAEARDAFLAAKRTENLAPSYLDELRRVLASVTAWDGLELRRVRPEDVQKWLSLRGEAGSAPGTRKKERAILASFFAWAKAQGMILANPVEAIAVPKLDRVLPRWLLPSEFRRLHDSAPGEWRLALQVLAATGLRSGEFCRLEAGAIRGGHLLVSERKGNEDLSLPCPPALETAIRAVPGLGRIAQDSLYRAVKGSALAAGLADVHPHVLRHSAATWLCRAGVPILTVRGILGHSSVTQTEQYAHLTDFSWPKEAGNLPVGMGAFCPLVSA